MHELSCRFLDMRHDINVLAKREKPVANKTAVMCHKETSGNEFKGTEVKAAATAAKRSAAHR